MSKSAPRLGKGLTEIIGPRTTGRLRPSPVPPPAHTAPAPATNDRAERAIYHVPVGQIAPNPHQPRANIDNPSLHELAASIKRTGVLQPVLLRMVSENRFQLVAGERRWRAATLAGLDTIPAIVRELTERQAFEIALIENLQREDLGPLERATAYQQLVDTFGVTVEQLADRLAQSRASIANYLRLRSLCGEIQQLIADGRLGMGQARAIAGISNPQRQLAIARLAVRRNLSVRQVETLAKERTTADLAKPEPQRTSNTHLLDLEQAFGKALGLPVKLLPGKRKNSGRVVIRYNSLEEFDHIAQKLGAAALLE